MDSDPFSTQRDVGTAVFAELSAAGFADADEIGRGGFGIVFRCTQVALDRVVAVKVLTADLDEDRERFLREQIAMGRLTGHPNIVGVLQVGETESGYPYLVMQYHRQGSLEARIKRLGVLPVDEVLRLGVKMAGALATAHRLEILHRDVKPANILLTDYGEPALSDFGIAHIAGGFKTATGTFTGSPAFTAPELLSGDPPSTASDVYSLGATLFAALTGHAAYERRSGEQVVAQFLRIATEAIPNLREGGIPHEVCAIVEKAMARNPQDRPSAAELGEELRRGQAARGVAVDEMALRAGHQPGQSAPPGPVHRRLGNLPLELTSFVGRRAELAELTSALTACRLVTLTGIGGVGKTRLALRAASEVQHDFADGVWLAELGELRDGSLLVHVVASKLGLRDQSGRPLQEVLVDFVASRELLLVLDNCEHLIDAAATLAETLLTACPALRILATSREGLGIGGESVIPIAPLTLPDADREPTLRGLPGYDAVALFAERAAAVVPGFALSDANKATVAQICSRLDGLPLAIELAAARLRAMSAEQVLERLADRYALLTRGSRLAPARQQTMSWSVGWSYDLCTPAEQRLWSRLSVFAGSFELQAAEDICASDFGQEDILDLVSSLVDKSILIRTESQGAVRFRLLETLRDYGAERIRNTCEYLELRCRHRDWYHRLVVAVQADWFSPRQLSSLERLEREMPNVREALEFSLADCAEAALGMAAALHRAWLAHGTLSEGRRWLDRALAANAPEPTRERIEALYGATMICAMQGDLSAAKARMAEARILVERMADPVAHGLVGVADGYVSELAGEFDSAQRSLEDAVRASDDPIVSIPAMVTLGWALALRDETVAALRWHERALAIMESSGETVFRSYTLWATGFATWRHGDADRAEQLLTECLRLTRQVDDPRQCATCLEMLAWVVADVRSDAKRAGVLMGAADSISRAVGTTVTVFPQLAIFHDDCGRWVRDRLGAEVFEAVRDQGRALGFDAAIAFALNE
jgi:non-specific serine/threonine protein kinase